MTVARTSNNLIEYLYIHRVYTDAILLGINSNDVFLALDAVKLRGFGITLESMIIGGWSTTYDDIKTYQ